MSDTIPWPPYRIEKDGDGRHPYALLGPDGIAVAFSTKEEAAGLAKVLSQAFELGLEQAMKWSCGFCEEGIPLVRDRNAMPHHERTTWKNGNERQRHCSAWQITSVLRRSKESR